MAIKYNNSTGGNKVLDSAESPETPAVIDSSLEEASVSHVQMLSDSDSKNVLGQSGRMSHTKKLLITNAAIIAAIILIGVTGLVISSGNKKAAPKSKVSNFSVSSVPTNNVAESTQLQVQGADQLNINGQVRVGNTLVITPSSTPTAPVNGQIYYNQQNNQLYYYNSKQFVGLSQGDAAAAAEAAAQKSSVLSVQGQTGAVTLRAGSGISINGTVISNSGVVSLNGTAGQINVSQSNGSVSISLSQDISSSSSPTFAGLKLSNLAQAGLLYGGGSTPIDSLATTGAGLCLISTSGAPTWGTCSGGGITGTPGAIAYFSNSATIGSSILSQDITNSNITVAGGLNVTGNVSVTGGSTISGNGSGITNLNAGNVTTGVLSLNNGGTGANNPASARSNIHAASNGVNSDITELDAVSILQSSSSLTIGAGTAPLSLLGSGMSNIKVGDITSGKYTNLNLSPLAGLGGAATIYLPNTSGTLAVAATGPISLNAGTGTLSCATCLVSNATNGGVLGVVSIQGQTGVVTFTAGTGININGTVVSNTGVTSLSGTANEVTASQSNGAVTLSLPQRIDNSAIPTFSDLILGGLPQNGILYTGASSQLNSLVASSPNLCLLSTAGVPAWAACPSASGGVSGTAGDIAFFTSPSTIGNSLLNQDINNTFITDNGGLVVNGNLSVSSGFTIAGNGSNVTNLNVDNVTAGTLTVTNGGTGANTFTSNGILYGNGTGSLQATAAAANSVLVTDSSGNPSLSQTLPAAVQGNITTSGVLAAGSIGTGFGTINTTNNITTTAILQAGTVISTGTLQGDNLSVGGGLFVVDNNGDVTSATNITASGTIIFSGLSLGGGGIVLSDTNGQLSDVSDLGIVNGGTGANTFTSNGILYGNGTGSLQATAAAANSVLVTDSSGNPSLSQTLPAAVQGNITTSGVLAAGSIGTGFGTINTTNNITTTAILQAGTVISTGTLQGDNLSVGGGLFVVDSSGNITSAASINVSGAATFSALGFGGGGVVQSDNIGQLYDSSTLGIVNGGTGASTAVSARTNLQAAASGANSDITSLSAVNSIDNPSRTLSVGDVGQALTLQGSDASTFSARSVGGQTTTLSFVSPTSTSSILIPNNSGTIAVSASAPLQLDGTGTLSCAHCLVDGSAGGGVPGVISINTSGGGLTGDITLQGGAGIDVSTVGNTVTLATAQDISPTASPTFAGLILNGSLGVGTNSPNYQIDVNGNANVSGGYYVNGVQICTSSGCAVASGSGNYIQNGTTLQTASFAINGASPTSPTALIEGASLQSVNILSVQNSVGTSLLAVAPNGFVGINNSNPGYYLDVNGDINTTGVYRINGTQICDTTGCNPTSSSTSYVHNGTSTQTLSNFNIQSANASSVGGVIQGAAGGQTADLLDLRDSTGANVFTVSSAGAVQSASILSVATTTTTYTLNVGGDIGITAGSLYIGGNQICTSTGCIASGGSGTYVNNGTTTQTLANFNIQSANASNVGGVIQGAVGQSADLLDLRNSSGANVLAVGSTGSLSVNTGSNAYTLNVGGDINLSSGSALRIGGNIVCNVGGCGSGSISGTYIANNLSSVQSANFFIASAASLASPTAIIQQTSGQTGDLLQIQSSSAATIAAISNSGQLKVGSASAYNAALNIGTNTTSPSGGIYFGSDTNLYRSGGGILTSDGTINAHSFTQSGLDNSIGLLLQSATSSSVNSTNLVFKDNQATPQSISLQKQGTNLVIADNSGNSQFGFNTASASLLFGTSLDTSLFRSNTNSLATNGNLSVGGILTNTGSTLVKLSSVSAFQIQDAGAFNVLSVNTTARRIGIDLTSPSWPLDVNGDINTNNDYRIGGAIICQSNGCTAAPGGNNYIQNTTVTQTANFNIQSASSTSVGAVIQAASSQTADLLQLESSSAVTASFSSTGGQLKLDSAPVGAYTAALTIGNASDTTALDGINFGGDSTLYRSAAHTLTTDGQLIVAGSSALTLGETNTNTGSIAFNGSGTGSIGHITLLGQNSPSVVNNVLTLPDETGTLCSTAVVCTGYAAGSGSGSYIQNGTTEQSANYNIQSNIGGTGVTATTPTAEIQLAAGQTGDLLDLYNGSTYLASFSATGASKFENSLNSTNAFQVQNSLGVDLFNVNTTAGDVGIGTGATAPANLLSIGNLTTPASTAQLAVSTGGAGNVGVIIQGASSQTADLLDLQNSAGSVLLGFSNSTFNGTSTATMQGGNGAGLSQPGVNLIIAGGAGTGAGNGGTVSIEIAAPPAAAASIVESGTATTGTVDLPQGIAATSNAIYWSNGAPGVNSPNKKSVYDDTTSGFNTPKNDVSYITTGGNPQVIASDGTYAYWATGAGAISRDTIGGNLNTPPQPSYQFCNIPGCLNDTNVAGTSEYVTSAPNVPTNLTIDPVDGRLFFTYTGSGGTYLGYANIPIPPATTPAAGNAPATTSYTTGLPGFLGGQAYYNGRIYELQQAGNGCGASDGIVSVAANGGLSGNAFSSVDNCSVDSNAFVGNGTGSTDNGLAIDSYGNMFWSTTNGATGIDTIWKATLNSAGTGIVGHPSMYLSGSQSVVNLSSTTSAQTLMSIDPGSNYLYWTGASSAGNWTISRIQIGGTTLNTEKPVLSFTADSATAGAATFHPIYDSTAAFNIQNAASTNTLFQADTVSQFVSPYNTEAFTGRIGIGQSSTGVPALQDTTNLSTKASLEVEGDVNITGAFMINGVQICNPFPCGSGGSGGGGLYINNATGPAQTANFYLQSVDTTHPTAVLEANTSAQTSNLLELRDYNNNVISEFSAGGILQGYSPPSGTTNTAGNALAISGGVGTGTGAGGDIDLQIAKAGSSGTLPNALTTVFSLSGSTATAGAALFKNAVNSSTAFRIQNTSATPTTIFNVDTSALAVTTSGLLTVNSGAAANNALDVSGEPNNIATVSLVQVGATPISGGNAVNNGGTYIGINEPSSSTGSKADFLDLQRANTKILTEDYQGNLMTYGSLNVNGAASGATYDLLLGGAYNNTTNGLYFGATNGAYIYATSATALSTNSSLSATGTLSSAASSAALLLGTAPVSGATKSLVQLGSVLSGGSANGTYISAYNSSGTTSNYLDFENFVAGSAVHELQVTSAGALTANGLLTSKVGATLGVASTANGVLTLNASTNAHTITIAPGTTAGQANNIAISIPNDPNATDTLCLVSLNNCASAGTVTTTGGTQNYITKYNNAGANQLTKSEIYDSGSAVSIGNASPVGLFSVGTTNQFQVASTGAVTAVGVNSTSGQIQGTGGISLTGGASFDTLSTSSTATIGGGLSVSSGGASISGGLTLTGLGSGVLQSTSGVLGVGNVTNAELMNNSVTVTPGTGLSGGGSVALGASTTLSVNFGAGSGQVAQGNNSITCTGATGTNLSGGGSTVAVGASSSSCGNISLTSTPSFTGTLTDSQGGAAALVLSGSPQVATGSSLVQIGSTIGGGSSSANGTYIGINEPSSGNGSLSDFLNLQNNNVAEFRVSSSGAVIENGGLTINSGGANVTGSITLASLGAGVVQSSSAGLLSSGSVPNNLLANSSLTIANGTAITGGGVVSLGGTLTLGVSLGSGAAQAAAGNESLTFAGNNSGNLTGSITETAGGGVTANNLAVVSNPTFSGTLSDTNAALGLALTGTVAANNTSSLLQLGSTGITVGGSNGTYIGVNEGGSTADFLDFQNNSGNALQVTSAGNIVAAGTINGLSVTSGVLFSPTISQASGGVALKLKNTAGQTGDLLEALDSSNTLLSKLDSLGNLTVQSAEIKVDLTLDGHFLTTGTTPTALIGVAAGTGGSSGVTIRGDDTLGTVTITTGTNPSSSGVLATVTFSKPFGVGVTPQVVLSPTSSSASNSQYYVSGITNTGFQISVNAVPAAASTYTYSFFAGQ